MSQTIWPELDDPPSPQVDLTVAENLASNLYGLEGQFFALPSERDQLFRIESKMGDQYLLRISGAGESREALTFQNAALRHIEAADPTLPVPRLCKSRQGNDIEAESIEGTEHGVRVLTYLPGVPMQGRQSSSSLRNSVGISLARLDRALESLRHFVTSYPLLWDVRNTALIRAMLPSVEGKAARAALDAVFSKLQDDILPRTELLASQVIHNDFNRKNVLFDPANPGSVSGIIDFGDMTTGPRTIDLGVAVARHIDRANAVEHACEIVCGYTSVSELSAAELKSLFWFICARLAMRAVIWSWRGVKGDTRSDPEEISLALDLLGILQAHGEEEMVAMFGSR